MNSALLLCLISCFTCSILNLKPFGQLEKIKDGYGLVVLELDKFDLGDKIYITYTASNGNISNFIYYSFTDEYPNSDQMNLSQLLNAYEEGSNTQKHNVSNGHGGRKIYYTYDKFYYYEFEKKTNSKYLVMRYSFSPNSIDYLTIENTRLNSSMSFIIPLCATLGGVVLIVVIILILRRRTKCCRGSYSYKIDYNSKKNKKLPITPNSEILPPMDMNNNVPMDSNYVTDKPYYIQDNVPPSNIYPPTNNSSETAYNYGNNLPPSNDCTYNSS